MLRAVLAQHRYAATVDTGVDGGGAVGLPGQIPVPAAAVDADEQAEDAQIRALDEMAQKESRSRAAVIREAVDDLLAKRRASSADDAFGLWSSIDGVAYQDRLRREW